MHQLKKLIKQVNKTHRRLGPLIAVNLLCAKAKRCILNVAPAGCGKSAATDTINEMLKGKATKYTSLTLAGLKHIAGDLTEYGGHLIVDDLGSEKSLWSRTQGEEVVQDEPSEGCRNSHSKRDIILTLPDSNRNGACKSRIHTLHTQNNANVRNLNNKLPRLGCAEHPTRTNEQPRRRRRLDSSRKRQSATLLPPNKTATPTRIPPNTRNSQQRNRTPWQHPPSRSSEVVLLPSANCWK